MVRFGHKPPKPWKVNVQSQRENIGSDEATSASSLQGAENLHLLETLLVPSGVPRPSSMKRSLAEDIAYLDGLHQAVFDWYVQAETKAQTILGFTGVFLSIFVSALLITPSAPQSVQYPQALLLFTIVSYTASVVLSVIAIWSRGMWMRHGKGIVFFGAIADYQDVDLFAETTKTVVGTEEHARQITYSIYRLARNTRAKHRVVDLSAVFSGAGLVSTLLLLFFR